MFRHPKYYKELRKRNKEAVAKSGISSHASLESDQAISKQQATASSTRSPGPGPKQQAIDETVPHNDIEEAASLKRQASSNKLKDPQATSDKRQAPSSKRQA